MKEKIKPISKKILFVRYINAQCVIKEFDSFMEAVRYVYKTSGEANRRKLSENLKKRIHGQIRDAINNKEYYCGGQWIDATQ